jgi:hypothetical protein
MGYIYHLLMILSHVKVLQERRSEKDKKKTGEVMNRQTNLIYAVGCAVVCLSIISCEKKAETSNEIPAYLVEQDLKVAAKSLFSDFLISRKQVIKKGVHDPYALKEELRLSQLSDIDQKLIASISNKNIAIFTSIKDGDGCSSCDGLKDFMEPHFKDFAKSGFYILYVEIDHNQGKNLKVVTKSDALLQVSTSEKNPMFTWSSGWPNTLFFVHGRYQGSLGYGFQEKKDGSKERSYVWKAHQSVIDYLRVSSNIK